MAVVTKRFRCGRLSIALTPLGKVLGKSSFQLKTIFWLNGSSGRFRNSRFHNLVACTAEFHERREGMICLINRLNLPCREGWPNH